MFASSSDISYIVYRLAAIQYGVLLWAGAAPPIKSGVVAAILRAGAAPPFKWVRLGVVGAIQSGVLLWAGAAPPSKIGRRGDVGAI